MRKLQIALHVFGIALAAALPCFSETTCEKLALLKVPGATVTTAEAVAAGNFTPGSSTSGKFEVPAFCRIVATLRPTSDSSIEIEVWLPENWNGKYQAVGNGGWAGVISYAAMASALADGYATSSTDTGHKGADAKFAPGHPEKMVDYAYRAVHEMTVYSKAVIQERHGRPVKFSYWNGCSTGGRQGLQEAQRYPADYDAIIAGAPANSMLHLNGWDLKAALVNQKDEAHLVPQGKLAVLHSAVLAACDGNDGVRDGLVSDPAKCRFDPASLLCKGTESASCLSKAQLESVEAMYAPAKRADGTLIYPGMPFGGEHLWSRMYNPAPFAIALSTFQHALHEDPNWDWRTFNLEREVAAADTKLGFIQAISPDLKAFRDRGGKLLMYHGWADQLISAQNSINYRASVEAAMGGNQDSWMRLFMAPGMGHCRGGDGPDQFHAMAALERWREASEAPAQIVAARVRNNRVEITRPLCPHPSRAVYKGSGSTDDAANFSCRVP